MSDKMAPQCLELVSFHIQIEKVLERKFWTGIILFICPANERRRYNVTSPLIGWAYTQNGRGVGSTKWITYWRIPARTGGSARRPCCDHASSPPSAAYMRQWIGSSLIQVMAWRLFWRQAITRTNAALLSIGLLATNFSEIWFEILSFSFKKMHLKMSSATNGGHFVWEEMS